MGRDAGWLTAAAALPRLFCGVAPDLCYLPEVPFNLDEFYSSLEKAFEKHPNVVVAVSEGVKYENGVYVGEGTQSGSVDAFGHKYLQGTAKALEILVKEKFGCKTRSVELNLPQRCAAHIASYSDISESFETGKQAVYNAPSSNAVMVCMVREEPYKITHTVKKVYDIANKIKYVPREYITEDGSNVTDACLEYLLPMIEGEWSVKYERGLPVHFVFEK